MNIWPFALSWRFVAFWFWFAALLPSERVALAAALLVLIGVAGEYIIEVPAIEKAEQHKTIIKRLSIAVLLLGLAGDVLGVVMGQAEMAALTRETGDAARSAHNAAQDAQNAHDLAQSASEISGRAKTTADGAESEAGTAVLKADAVSKKVGQINAALSEAEFIISARRIQDENGLESDLAKGFKGRYIVFESYMGDEEAYWLCAQLLGIAQKAGVNAKDECATRPLLKQLPITDLHISAPTFDEAKRLSMILKKTGRVPGYFVGLNEAPEVTVTIGVKPSVPLWPKKAQQNDKPTSKASAEP
jgi:hypothetical protein